MRRVVRSFVLPAVGVAAILVLAGCTGDEGDPAPSTSASTTGAPQPTASATSDETAAVLDTYHRYWDAVVLTEQGNADATLFDGVASGQPVEVAIATATQFKELGIVREGAPTFSQETVTVAGDSATVYACVDNTAWVIPGVADDPAVADVLPGGVLLTRTDGVWLVTGSQQPPAEFTC
jgi:hypothetical protein